METARRLAMACSVHSLLIEDVSGAQQMSEVSCEAARREGFAKPAQFIVVLAGMPFGTPGTTNLMRIATV